MLIVVDLLKFQVHMLIQLGIFLGDFDQINDLLIMEFVITVIVLLMDIIDEGFILAVELISLRLLLDK